MSQVDGVSSILWVVIRVFGSNPHVISHLKHGRFILAQTIESLKIDESLHSLGWGGQLGQLEHQTLNKRKFKISSTTSVSQNPSWCSICNMEIFYSFSACWRGWKQIISYEDTFCSYNVKIFGIICNLWVIFINWCDRIISSNNLILI